MEYCMNVAHLYSGCWPRLVQMSGINGAVLCVYAIFTSFPILMSSSMFLNHLFWSLSSEFEFCFFLQLCYKLFKFSVISKKLMWGFPVDSKQHLQLCLSMHSGNWVTDVFVHLLTATAGSPYLTYVRSCIKKKITLPNRYVTHLIWTSVIGDIFWKLIQIQTERLHHGNYGTFLTICKHRR